MKKVAIFRAELLRISETFIYEQARALRDWQPILVGLRDLGEPGLKTPGISRVLIKRQNSLLETFRFWFARPVPSAVKTFQSLGVDLVHAHFGTDATEIWPSVRAAGLPMVVTLHGYDINIHREWWESGRDGLRRRVYPRRLLKMARDPGVTFIAVSRAIKKRAVEYGIPEEKISVAYIGVDINKFKPGGSALDQREMRILFVGRMVPKKAPLLLIDAFAEVSRKIPRAELVMVGDGPLLEQAKRKVAALGVNVSFLGAQSVDGILAELKLARVFCLPSIIAENGDAEGLPVSVIEAQICGLPVVTTQASEVVIDGETGSLISEGSESDIEKALVYWMLRAPSFVGDVARIKFDICRCIDELQNIYSKSAGGIRK